MDHIIGVDLGQFSSYAAACVLRRTVLYGLGGEPERTSTGAALCRFDVMAIRRYALGTEYTSIVSHIVGQAQRPELRGPQGQLPRIFVDGTGVGAPVVELLKTALLPHPRVECWAAVITAGRAVTQPKPGTVHVAKQELAGCLRSVLESSRLRVPRELEFADALKRELGDFTVKVTQAGNETYTAEPGQYDDLVICIAIPVFLSSWLDARLPAILGPGPLAAPRERRSGSYAATQGGVLRPHHAPELDRPPAGCYYLARQRLFDR